MLSASPGRRGLPALVRSLLVMALAVAGVLVVTPPAQAGYTTLCVGYKGCRDAGMGAAGYPQNSGTMYWRMYSGHNCTNYAAYRMVKSGLPNVRPWEGSGNATNWGTAMSRITDQTPTVGSIAWWKAGVPGGGSVGHLAYVEQVVDATTIVVSQDSWGGDFSWARITSSGTGWPSGFIHFNDVPLRNTAPPTVTGLAKVGGTLTASAGEWKPGDPDLTFLWLADGRRIDGARGAAYTVPKEHQGKALSVRVKATKIGYPEAKVTSAATEEVLPGQLVTTSSPAIAGTPVVDGTLTATLPSWNVTPDSQTVEWLADGKPVAGAAGPQLVLRPGQVGQRISARVTARREGYTATTVSSPTTATVQPGTLVAPRPVLTGTPRPGHELVLDPGGVAPEAHRSIQWFRDGTPLEGVTGTTYRLTAEDLGARIDARVAWERTGYHPLQQSAGATPRIKTQPTMDVTGELRRRNRLRLTASLTSVDLAPVTGQLVVKERGKVLLRREVTRGTRSLTVRGLDPGRHRIVVRFAGTRVATPVRAVHRVRVPR